MFTSRRSATWCAVALCAACRDASTAHPPTPATSPVEIQASEVVCRIDIEGFAYLGGTNACESALRRFLGDHPLDGIVAVIPIEATAPPSPDARHQANPGTQRLVVVHHAGDGPGLRADNVRIVPYVCNPKNGGGGIGPAHCQVAMQKSVADYEFNHQTIFVPLTGEAFTEGVDAGTQLVLALGPRDVNRPPQAAP